MPTTTVVGPGPKKWSLASVIRTARDVAIVVLIGVGTWRRASVQISVVNFDLSEILAVALALFAVGLSAAFDFKTTETSNLFYDASFRFTKDISETLGRLEERFGERLRHIDENYSGIHAKLMSAESQAVGIAAKVEEERKALETLQEDRRSQVEELILQAAMSDADRDLVRDRLASTELDLEQAREHTHVLNQRLDSALARAETLRDHPALHRGERSEVLTRFDGWIAGWLGETIAAMHTLPATLDGVMTILDEKFGSFEGTDMSEDALSLGYYDRDLGWRTTARKDIRKVLSGERRRRA